MTDRIGAPEARHAVITRLLAENGRLDVAEVADVLGVAPETVRRDLRALETAGVLRRVHGGAIPIENATRVPVQTLAAPEPASEAVAACVWADLPRTGTVLLGSGPLALALTHALMTDPPTEPGLTVVTNSLDAAVHLARIPALSVYNVGGSVARQTRAQEGDWALEELGRLRVDVALLSPAGVSTEHGLSESTPAAAAVAQAIVACSARRIVVCSSATLGQDSFVRFAGLDEVHHLFVAGQPDEATVRSVIDHGVPVTVPCRDRTEGRRHRTVA